MESLKQFMEAAQLYERAQIYDKAVLIYLKSIFASSACFVYFIYYFSFSKKFHNGSTPYGEDHFS